MITHYFKTVQDVELKTLETPRTGVWTHVVSPSEEEVATIVREYALDEAILEDAQDFYEVPRMERSGGVSYFFTRYPFEQDNKDIETAPLMIAMGESFVLTMALREVPQFAAFMAEGTEIVTTQKTKLFITLIQSITDSFEKELTRLRRVVHKDRAKLRRIGPREIQRLVNYEHELNNLIAAVVPTNMWLNQVTNGNFIQLYNEDIELMEDLMIGNGQLIDSSRQLLKTIQNVRSASEAIMTSTLNTTIKTLTIVTILLTIPTIVSSLYGMNVALPLAENQYAFPFVMVLIGVFVAVTMYIFKRNDWL